jgi:hypothetical protein
MLKGPREYYQKSLPALLFLSLSFFFCLPLLKELYSSCSGDWDYFMSLYEVPSITLFEYRQFPLWNPYWGGGTSLIGNPQAGYLSPIFLLTSFFGVVAGLKIAVWLHTFLGLWGMWVLSGYLGITGPARLAPSFIFMFSGTWALHIAAGHVVWLPAALLPFFFLMFLKGLENRWWLLAAATMESIMFYEGGTYVFAFSLLFVFVYVAVYSIEIRSLHPLVALLIANAIAAGLSAPKLLPVIELLQSHPRPTDTGSSLPLEIYVSFFMDRFKGLERSVNNTGWWAFGSYLGVVVIALYLFSFRLFKKNKALIISSLFLLLLSMGNFSVFSPWQILHNLPFFSGFKLPTRVLIVFCFTVALLAGRSLAHLGAANSGRSKLLVGLVVFIILCDLSSVSFPTLGEAQRPITTAYWANLRTEQNLVAPTLYQIPAGSSSGLWSSVPSFRQSFKQISIPFSNRNIHGAWSDQYLPLLQNRGVVDAYETITFERYALANSDKEYKGEYYFKGSGIITLRQWSPNRFEFHVTANKKDQLVINQNFAKGWNTSHGTLTSYGGLLAVDLPSGSYGLEIYYLPQPFLVGVYLLIMTLCTILLIVAGKLFKTLQR